MKHKGFTLIELVIVIIILGILAVVAIPKFIDLQKDARIADLKGIEASLKSANSLVYSEASLKDLTDLEYGNNHNDYDNSLLIDGRTITLHYGHVLGTSWNVSGILNVSKVDWHIVGTQGVFATSYIMPRTAPAFDSTDIATIEASQCYLSYGFTNQSYRQPVYTLKTSGC